MSLGPSRRIAAGLLFAVSAGATGIAFAQTSQGILSGVARDATGAVVPNATVAVTNQETGLKRTVKTATDGAYRIEAITPGRYSIITTASGFDTTTVKDVAVLPSVVTSYNVTLGVGSTSTEVTVEANQGSINTDNGELAGNIDARQLDKLPVFSLNPVELTLTVPGVQPVTGSGQFSNGINIQVNGARPRSNNFLMDGQEINDISIGGQAFQPQIPDIFDSVAVITNSASAEYGRGGGGIVNLVTKSGSNKFHGTLFERYTGSGLNSIPGPQRGSGVGLARSDEHSFGFTVGGPILKNKLFFFGAGEWQRTYGRALPGLNLLPDAAGWATLQQLATTGGSTVATQVGLLNQYLSNGAYLQQDSQYAPVGGAGSITANVGALPGCPTSGCTVSFAGFQRQALPQQNPDTQWMYRVDYHPWDKDSLSFRYLHDRTSLNPDFFNNGNALLGFDSLQGGPSELGEGQWTHVFGPRLLNEFRVSEARLSFEFAPTPATLANPLNLLPTIEFAGINGTTTGGAADFLSGAETALGPNQNFPQGRDEDLYQFQDTVRYTRGRQSLSIGADIGRLIEIDLVPQNSLGTLDFAAGGSGVSSLGNFLLNQLGPSGTATKTLGPTRADSHNWRNSAFAQDDIKVTPDLTVNLGVRYDYLSNPENAIQYPGVDPSNVFAPINTVTPVNKDWNNIAPRIGFAYSPHGVLGFLGDGKTSIRGGFGVFYDSTFSNILTNTLQSAPNSIAGTIESTTGNGVANASAQLASFLPTLTPSASVESEDAHLVNPLTYQYNLGIEREIPAGIVLGIRYVGNRGEKLFANQQYNYFNGVTGQRLQSNRGPIVLRGNYADSNYNGLEVTGTHNFKHGLLVSANYNFSKDLDDASEIFTIAGSSPSSYSPNLAPGGLRQNYGPSAYDHRQFFSVSYVYQIPGLHSTNRLTDVAENILTRHWTISGVTQLQSGSYSSFNTSGFDLNSDGSNTNDRPVLSNQAAPLQSIGVDGSFVGGNAGTFYDMATYNQSNGATLTPVSANQVHFLVPNFPNNQYLQQEIGRNSFAQPGTTTNNVSLEKGFDFKEYGTFILRAEAQNIANHNDLTVGDLDVLDAGAGFLSPTRGGVSALNANQQRTLVLWAKFEF